MLLRRSPRRTRRRVVAGAVALLVAGLAALTVWPVLAVQARDAVVVAADARPFLCRTGAIRVQGPQDDPLDPDDHYTSALQVASGLDCDLRFVVANDGSLPVSVRAVELPFLGPDSGVPVEATALDGGFFLVRADAIAEGRDARFVVPGAGLTVPAGDDVVLFARLRLKAQGCLSRGGTFSAGDSPAVTVSALGLDGVRTPDVDAWTYEGTGPASCPGR